MAAAEVLAFAASDGWHAAPSFSRTARQGEGSRCRGDKQVGIRLQSQLSLISEAWIQLRSSPQSASSKDRPTNPLIVPDFCSPRWSRTRRLPAPSIDDSQSSVDLRNLSSTDSAAELRRLGPETHDAPLPSSQASRQRRDDRDADLLADPNMDLIDFGSDEGFIQAAGKKKKKQTTSFNWLEDENDKKDGDANEEGGDGNKDPNDGDAGAGGNAGGDGGGDDGGKKDDDKNGAEAAPDDIWGFSTVGSKKKKNKDKTADAFGLPEVPPVSTDFHEIKLDDSGGASSLDFGLSPKTEKSKTGISAWTSGWGGGGWGWGGLGGSQTEASKPAQEEKTEYPADDSPWGINRPKPKKKETSTFSFGALGEDDGSKDANNFDFLGGSKSSGAKDAGAFSWGAPKPKTGDDDFWGNLSNKKDEPPKEEEKPAEEAADDIWGWSSTKKDKKKKGKVTVIEESQPADASQDDPPPETPDAPEASDKQPESALTPDEEAELLKLQTKKDIGSKLTKKQTDRYKILTDKVEEAAKAAEALASKPAEPARGDPVDLLDDTEAPADVDPAGGSAPLDDAQAEADEMARIIQEEEEEMTQLRGKKKLKKSDKDRLRILEDRADERLREAEEKAAASGTNGQDDVAPEVVDVPAGDSAPGEDPVPEIDAAQAEADEKARIAREEEEEMAELRSKKKLKRADKDRLQELEDRAASRAREAEELAAAAQAEADAAQAAAAQAEADEKARIVQEEEEELAQLRAKKKLKSADKERIRILEENADLRAREAQIAQPDELSPESGADSNEFKSDETAPTSVDDAGAQAEKDENARLIEQERLEIELLLSKSKLKKADKTRLKELQDNRERREQDAAAKADAAAVPDTIDESLPPAEDAPTSGDVVEPNPSEGYELAKKLIEEEELELELLLSKSKLKKAEKARLTELQDNRDQREYEAAAKAASEPAPDSAEPPADGALDSGPVLDEAPIDEAAAQEALVAAEESELTDLLSKAKLKKAEKARLKELQDRKDQRDKEARMAAEKAEEDERLARENAEQEARELEERKRREEIEAEEAEITSLKSKKKLKKSEKDRLSELEFRAQDRASAEAEKLAAELLKEDAENEVNKHESKASKGFSWADDDPADDNGAGDDWMDWGLSSSKKLKKKDKSSPLIEFGGTSDALAVLDVPPAIPEADAFDFGWGKPKKKDVQSPADDLWSFGGSSKKKSKNPPAEVVDDPIKADFMGDTKDKMGGDDFWSTFGVDKKDKSSRKNALATQPPPPAPTPPCMDLTETEVDAHDAGDVWDDPSGSTELSRSKSKSSDKDSKKSSKEPKLSKKELEKLEKEKKKAEKEQKEREKREAEEAAEKERIAEEERLAAEAKAEEERLAREAEELARQEEEAKQAAIDAVALEEADLAVLQAKKDSGKKLTKKDKEKYDKLYASCQARADEKAAQEAAEQAERDEEERLAREAEELARQQEIEKEEAELQELQKKKDSGRKLLKKDKEKYDLLRANKKARDKAAEAASDPKDEAAPADGDKADDDLDKDLAELDANQLDELDQFLSSPTKPTARAAEVDPFDFWGASKKSPKPKKGKSPGAEPLLEATTSRSATVENSAAKDVVAGAWSAWQDTYPSSRPRPETQFGGEVDHHDLDTATSAPASTPSPALMKGRKSVGGKIADRLKAFEATIPPPPPAPVSDAIPPPPPPPPAEPVAEDGKKKKKSKSRAAEIPGSFPVEEDEQLPDDIVEVIEMSPKIKKSKKSKSKTEDAASVPPPPPPPPAVPDAPLSPPPEVVVEPKKDGKKERAKINRDGGSSWGMWSASTPSGKEKKSSKPKASEEPRREKKSRSPEKEEKLSAPGSSSDKAERSERVRDMAKETPVRPKLMSVFNSTPPISRSMSTREKRPKEGKSSRRSSFDVPSGIVSPPPEDEVPTMSSKAARILGVGIGDPLGRSSSKRKKTSRTVEEDDIVMVGANDAMESSPDKSSRRRHKQYPREDDDIVMVDAADATPPPGLRRSNTSGSAKKGFGALFGGILPTPKTDPKPELRRRNTHHTTDAEDGGAATDVDAEARKAARRLRRAEREAADKEAEDSRRTKDGARREKRRRQEEEEREARRAERRVAKSRQEEERRAAEEKEAAREERRRQKRLERQQERESAAANGETAVEDDEARRAARRERRKARAAESDREHEQRHADDDEERRRRRAERRAARDTAEGKTSSRRRPERADDDLGRPSKISRRHTDGLDKLFRKPEPNPNPWPHSGTSSWVKDHSDAGPPPEDAEVLNEAMEDMDDDAARHERRRRRKYGDGVVDIEVGDEDGERRRRKRREERAGGSDGSGERKRHSYVGDAYTTATPRSSASSWWKKLKGN